MENRKITMKLYPGAKARVGLKSHKSSHKDLWNAALEERIDAYRKCGKSITYEDQCASLTLIREAMPDDWARINCSSQQITLRRLDKAFKGFFRRVAAGQTPGFPRFKNNNRMSGFGYKGHGDGWRFTPAIKKRHGQVVAGANMEPKWKGGSLYLSGIGTIRCRGEARQGGTVKSCELLNIGEDWFVSLTIEADNIVRATGAPDTNGAWQTGGGMMTADWGVEYLLSIARDDGTYETIENPRWFKTMRDQRLLLEQSVARKKRGSNHRRAAARKLARFHARVARVRLDHHHKLSAYIAATCYAFGTEALTIRNMTGSAKGTAEEPGKMVAQKAGLNREILDTAPALLLQLIAYKVNETGGQYREAPTRKLKPSQTCPQCLAVRKKLLSQRLHKCACGCTMQRDRASARVVLNWLYQDQTGQELPETRLAA